MLQGGVSTGRTVTDNCDVIGNDQGAVSACRQTTRACATATSRRFLTQVKMLGTYIVPKVDVNVAATFQSTPGADARRQPHLHQRGDASLARAAALRRCGERDDQPGRPGHMYGDRVNQLDLRFGKTIRFGARRASVNLDIYNVFNANPIMQENNAYAVWRTPQRIMDARLFKISGQLDF